jgi:hypothetical protein
MRIAARTHGPTWRSSSSERPRVSPRRRQPYYCAAGKGRDGAPAPASGYAATPSRTPRRRTSQGPTSDGDQRVADGRGRLGADSGSSRATATADPCVAAATTSRATTTAAATREGGCRPRVAVTASSAGVATASAKPSPLVLLLCAVDAPRRCPPLRGAAPHAGCRAGACGDPGHMWHM